MTVRFIEQFLVKDILVEYEIQIEESLLCDLN